MNVSRSIPLAVILVSLLGCGGKIERIDIAIPGQYTGATVSAPASETLRVTVVPFEDQRANQVHLGYRSHLWGRLSIFKSSSGSMTDASAQALVDYLNRQGWQVSLSRTAGQDGVDITIMGSLQELSIDATSGFMHTDLSAKNTLMLYVRNHSDCSIVSMHIIGKGIERTRKRSRPTCSRRVSRNFLEISDSKVELFASDN